MEDGWNSWVPVTHVIGPDQILGSLLWPGSTLLIAGIHKHSYSFSLSPFLCISSVYMCVSTPPPSALPFSVNVIFRYKKKHWKIQQLWVLPFYNEYKYSIMNTIYIYVHIYNLYIFLKTTTNWYLKHKALHP